MLVLIAVVAVVCGVGAIGARRLLSTALWLAAASAAAAGLLYAAGAPEVAVIELSVGVGLVPVLLVFAITTAGDPATPDRLVVPPALTIVLVTAAVGLLAALLLPLPAALEPGRLPLARVLWQDRALDVVGQIVLIFAGVLGVLGLLSGGERR